VTEKTKQYSVSGMASQAALLYFVITWQNLWQNTAKHFDNSHFLNAWCELRQYAKELTKRGQFYKITLIGIITIN
jgi:hypothetical protein